MPPVCESQNKALPRMMAACVFLTYVLKSAGRGTLTLLNGFASPLTPLPLLPLPLPPLP